jgi:hypothetical protein
MSVPESKIMMAVHLAAPEVENARQIYLIESELDQNKNGTSKGNFDLCRSADWTGPSRPELNTFKSIC